MPVGVYKHHPNQGFQKGYTPWHAGTKGLRICSEETKEKLSKSNKGKLHFGQVRKPCSEETKKKISNAVRGFKHTEEAKRKISKIKMGVKQTEEHKRKISEALKGKYCGEKNHRWNPNREEVRYDRRNDPEYKQWRKQVWIRDNWKCKINNQDCKGKIKAHHILPWRDFPELRYNINNGITLCQAHHPLKRAEEKRLIPFFQGLVPVSN